MYIIIIIMTTFHVTAAMDLYIYSVTHIYTMTAAFMFLLVPVSETGDEATVGR